MPRLTVVLVVHREQGWAERCVRSVLDQDFDDVELIAIDNASPDHAPAVLDAFAARDPRMSVVHLPQAVSIGEARNQAVQRASGDYLWFVRSPDRLVPGVLDQVNSRLKDTDAQVLVVHQQTTGPDGKRIAHPNRQLLKRAGKLGAFTLAQQPAVADLGPGVSDKVLRRDLMLDRKLSFGPGGFDELTVMVPALLAADRVAVLDEVGYLRTEPANADRTPAVHGSPAELIEQYAAVLDRLDEIGGRAAEGRRLLPVRIAHHGLAVLATLPSAERAHFFKRLSKLYARSLRGLDDPPRTRGLRAAGLLPLHAGSYAGYRAMCRAADVRKALRRDGKGSARDGTKASRRPGTRQDPNMRYYRQQLRQPLDPDLVAYAAYWYRDYACNPRAVYETAREIRPRLHGVWIVEADEVGRLPAGVDHVIAGTPDYYRLLARASYLVNNVNFPNEFVKREGQVFVQTHHGVPLKTMGMDLRETQSGRNRINFIALMRRCATWDYSVTANAHNSLMWDHAYPVDCCTLEVGYPRTDPLVNAGPEETKRVRSSLGIADDQRVVLYAPTHREYDRSVRTTVDLTHLAESVDDDFVFLARSHYSYRDDDSAPASSGRVIDVTAHSSIEELCIAADVLISDYSALTFDYAALDRPIVIHAPDWEKYRDMRGTYFDLIDQPPGVVTRTDDDLVAAFTSGAVWADDATAARAAFRARFCTLSDGRASERLIDAVWPSP